MIMLPKSFGLVIFGLIVMLLTYTESSSDQITQEDIEECGSSLFGRVECSSINFYRECIAPGAETIVAIKLHKNYSETPCTFMDTFGYRSNAVWVAGGCSAEFYICFSGELVSTYPPGLTKKPTNENDVAIASSAWESHKVVIYIIIGAVILILVGGGLIIGCILKQRTQREKSRRIAAKRQIRIDKQRQKREQQEGTITYRGNLNNAINNHRSRSLDYIEPDYSIDNEREGSICSTQSSNSGMTSVSCMTTGRMVTRSNYHKRFFLDQSMLKGTSTPDIRAIGSFSTETNNLNQKRNRQNSVYGSQTSLESIREICSRYKLYEIPLEKRLSRPSNFKRPTKYNTVGYSGPSLEKSIQDKTMTIPSRKRIVTALVHAPNIEEPIVEENKNLDRSGSASEIALESHYQDPESLLNPGKQTNRTPKSYTTKLNDGCTPWSSVDEGIQKDLPDTIGDHMDDQCDSKCDSPIYATVNKRNKCSNELKGTKTYNSNESQNKHTDTKTKLSEENELSETYHYALLHSFKPYENSSVHNLNS